MQAQNPSWGVVLTVDEPEQLVLANVAWHLSTGARHVHVYLDRPGDPAAGALAGHDRVRVTECDTEWWQAQGPKGLRPVSQMRRQAINANHARDRADTDWLLHLDADEFLWQHRPLVNELRHLAPFDCEVNVPVVERFYRDAAPVRSLFQGGFRRSTRGLTDFDAAYFGPLLPYLNKGLPGHSQGKSIVPTEGDYELGIHWSFRGGKRGPEHRARQFRSQAATLLHFDGLTPLHFVVKVVRYGLHEPRWLEKIVSEHRRAQVSALLQECGTLEEMLRFHDRLKMLDSNAESRLSDLGLIVDPAVDPAGGIAAQAGNADLSAGSFDAALRARHPEVFEVLRP